MPDEKHSPDLEDTDIGAGWGGVRGMKTMAQRESEREQEREQQREQEREQQREWVRARRAAHRRNGPYYALIVIAGLLATAAERLAELPPGVGHGPWGRDDIPVGLIFFLLNVFALWVASLFLGIVAAQIVIWFDRESRTSR